MIEGSEPLSFQFSFNGRPFRWIQPAFLLGGSADTLLNLRPSLLPPPAPIPFAVLGGTVVGESYLSDWPFFALA